MVYDEELADRIRVSIQGEKGITEQRMFGGLAFLVRGNMAVAASGNGGLMVRVDPADADALLSDPGVTRMVMRGREMPNWLRVTGDAVDDDAELDRWVTRCLTYARSLPAK
jgi:TfoX/Sxy family transcriptional regulator of competence genes